MWTARRVGRVANCTQNIERVRQFLLVWCSPAMGASSAKIMPPRTSSAGARERIESFSCVGRRYMATVMAETTGECQHFKFKERRGRSTIPDIGAAARWCSCSSRATF